jgi:hypothetical protein
MISQILALKKAIGTSNTMSDDPPRRRTTRRTTTTTKWI